MSYQKPNETVSVNVARVSYISMTVILCLALIGLPVVRYLAYLLPIVILVIATGYGQLRLVVRHGTLPFLLLLLVSFPLLVTLDFNSIKKFVFISTYTIAFCLVDFSTTRFDLRLYSGAMVLSLLAHFLLFGNEKLPDSQFTFSFMDSQSTLESTLAFPLALLGVYFLTNRRFLLALLHLLLVTVALKRVAVFAVLVAALIWLLPKRVRTAILHPALMTLGIAFYILLSVEFASGTFDSWILSTFSRAANDLSKGREHLWASALRGLEFSYEGFLFFGSGLGSVVTALQAEYKVDRILLHNDILSLALEIGLLPTLVFFYMLFSVRAVEQRLLALVLVMILATDNVIIYQHVMVTYLLILAQMARVQPMKPVLKSTKHYPNLLGSTCSTTMERS